MRFRTVIASAAIALLTVIMFSSALAPSSVKIASVHASRPVLKTEPATPLPGTRYVDRVFTSAVESPGIVYKVVNGQPLTFDLWQPKGDNVAVSRRWVVMIHGGAFQGGSPAELDQSAVDLAERGYAVINVSYRLFPNVWASANGRRYGATMADADVSDAINSVVTNASFLRLDPAQRFAFGYSAGAVVAWELANEHKVRAAATVAGYAIWGSSGLVKDWHGASDGIIPLSWQGTIPPTALRTFEGINHDVYMKEVSTIDSEAAVWLNDPTSKLTAAALTDHEVYNYEMPSSSSLTASYEGTDGNVRDVVWPASEIANANEEACAQWSSASGFIDQQGIALRVHEVDGGWRAITVTKNVWAGATWVFNFHVWDTRTTNVFTQFAAVPLRVMQTEPLPWNMCAKVVADTVIFRVWPSSAADPGYGNPTFGGSATLPAGWSDPGFAGWYAGHLQTGDRVTYSHLSVG